MNVVHFLAPKFFREDCFRVRSLLPDLINGNILRAIIVSGFFEYFKKICIPLALRFLGNFT